jgi:YggT family protein
VALSFLPRFLSAIVSIYMMCCSVRILLSWVPGVDTGRAGELLGKAVDPYLRWFRRFPVLRAGKFDFSPVAAVALLAVLNNVLTTLAFAGSISLGLVLGMLVGAAWSAVGFILSFFAICALLRVIAYAAHWNSIHPLWMTVDDMLNPVLYRINRLIYRDRIVNYLQGLVTGFAVLVALRAVGGTFAGFVIRLLQRLPF